MTDVVLHIRRLPDASLHAELRVDLPGGTATLGEALVSIDITRLLELSADPDAYGAALTAMAFPAPLHAAWQRARGHAEHTGQGLHVRVAISDPSGALHALRWELLRDPLTGAALATQEGGSLARQVLLDQTDELVTPALPPHAALRALVAVAGPRNHERWNLAPVAVAAEAARTQEALGNMG